MRLPFSIKGGLSSPLVPTGNFGTLSFTVDNVTELRKVFITEFGFESGGSEGSVCGRSLEDCAVVDNNVPAESEHNSQQQLLNGGDLDSLFEHFALRGRLTKLKSSPFPALDAFVISLASTYCLSKKECSIREITLYPQTWNIVFHLPGTRYCSYIGREHLRNTGTSLKMDIPEKCFRTGLKGKCPGPDGIPLELYLATWESMGPVLVELATYCRDDGKLPRGMLEGIITLLYKKGDKREIRNWRPISLLNVAYKIIAKTLTIHLAWYLPHLIGP
ncbi:hypothetical protein CBR_g22219 [Chara braunii]|uniref:Reverse transcriptase domain-containing protein n=1 Tax=Chara braunii TaxID=69332 RepID=A0A388L2E7_CHABU|nr:hypothetical protein CBR_g22219 [Chara braunii]|eukprot:GBG76471.1 hypothetical protein CBR_g22219 [Chara braunii]